MDHGSLSELGVLDGRRGQGCGVKEGAAARGEDATLTIDGAIAASKLVDRV